MTVTITVSAELEAKIAERAAVRGISVEDYAREVLERDAETSALPERAVRQQKLESKATRGRGRAILFCTILLMVLMGVFPPHSLHGRRSYQFIGKGWKGVAAYDIPTIDYVQLVFQWGLLSMLAAGVLLVTSRRRAPSNSSD